MNSRTRSQQEAHKEATRITSESHCLVCGAYGCEPAHFAVIDGEPRSGHRGMGGGKSSWQWGSWIPLCPTWSVGQCHDLIDRRLGVSERVEKRRQEALAALVVSALSFWDRAA